MTVDTSALKAAADELEAAVRTAEEKLRVTSYSLKAVLEADLAISGVKIEEITIPKLNNQDEFLNAVTKIKEIPKDVAAKTGEFGKCLSTLEQALEKFDNLPDLYADLQETAEQQLDQTLEEIDQLADRLVTALPERLEQLGDDLTQRLEGELKAVADELTTNMEERVSAAFDDAANLARDTVDGIEERTQARCGAFRDHLADMLQRELEQGVREFAEEAAEATLAEVADGMLVSEVSAQVTASMSSQLPQLMAAKVAVEVVRRALELMRAGF